MKNLSLIILCLFVILISHINCYSCYGIISNSTLVCSGQGNCTSSNICNCNIGYIGNNCENKICFGIASNISTVCSSNGNCTAPNTCNCKLSYSGNNCAFTTCYGISSNSSTVCSGKGSCISLNHCNCNANYIGADCSVTTCYGTFSNNSAVCSGKGDCITPNTCNCNIGYIGNNCENKICFGIASNISTVCSGRGICISPNNCNCNIGYSGSDCSQSIQPTNNSFCYVQPSTSNICYNQGICINGKCSCFNNYDLPSCCQYINPILCPTWSADNFGVEQPEYNLNINQNSVNFIVNAKKKNRYSQFVEFYYGGSCDDLITNLTLQNSENVYKNFNNLTGNFEYNSKNGWNYISSCVPNICYNSFIYSSSFEDFISKKIFSTRNYNQITDTLIYGFNIITKYYENKPGSQFFDSDNECSEITFTTPVTLNINLNLNLLTNISEVSEINNFLAKNIYTDESNNLVIVLKFNLNYSPLTIYSFNFAKLNSIYGNWQMNTLNITKTNTLCGINSNSPYCSYLIYLKSSGVYQKYTGNYTFIITFQNNNGLFTKNITFNLNYERNNYNLYQNFDTSINFYQDMSLTTLKSNNYKSNEQVISKLSINNLNKNLLSIKNFYLCCMKPGKNPIFDKNSSFYGCLKKTSDMDIWNQLVNNTVVNTYEYNLGYLTQVFNYLNLGILKTYENVISFYLQPLAGQDRVCYLHYDLEITLLSQRRKISQQNIYEVNNNVKLIVEDSKYIASSSTLISFSSFLLTLILIFNF